MNRKKTLSDSGGYTLGEIMLVLVLLTFIVFLTVPNYIATTDKVKKEADIAYQELLGRAVELYYLDVGKYPDRIMDLVERPEQEVEWRGPYLEVLPNRYETGSVYQIDTEGNAFLDYP